jgi:hypothetical protein
MPISCSGGKRSEPPNPAIRKCCMLSPIDAKESAISELLGGGLIDQLPDPAKIGPYHFGGGDITGQIFTCRAGFVDLGHLRDLIDLTIYYYTRLTKGGGNGKGKSIATFGLAGQVTVPDTIPDANVIDVARAMAYYQSVFYEIKTYWLKGKTDVGQHHSSFSPEDLVSNFLGTYVASQVLAVAVANDEFAASRATTAINSLLTTLGAQSPAVALQAFQKVSTKWVTSIDNVGDIADQSYLKRRNFNVQPIVPFLVPGLTACPSTDFPASIPRSFPAGTLNFFQASYVVPDNIKAASGYAANLSIPDLDAAIQTIKTDAAVLYGPLFDSPAL